MNRVNMMLEKPIRRSVIYLLSIMLALTMLIMLTALAKAQVPPPGERPEAAPAASTPTMRYLSERVFTTHLDDNGEPVTSAGAELLAPALVQQSCEGCDPVFVETATATGTHPMVITATEDISELTHTSGLVAPTIIDGLVSQDPNVSDPFDPAGRPPLHPHRHGTGRGTQSRRRNPCLRGARPRHLPRL
jgi:hypothetical protein